MINVHIQSDIETPRIFRQLAQRLADLRCQRLERKGFREMLKLDDHLLTDIGVTRGDIAHVARLPFAENPSLTLWRLSARNKHAR